MGASEYQFGRACARFEGELEAYLNGEARPFIDAHSQDCSTCSAVLSDLGVIRKAARELREVEPSDAVWAGLLERLHAERTLARADCLRFDYTLEAGMEVHADPFVASHAQECASCAALLADLASIRAAARELPEIEPSPALWTKLRTQLASERTWALSACTEFQPALAAYLEGEATPQAALHLEECATCAGMVADLRSIQHAASTLPLESPSEALWTRLRTQLEVAGILRAPACVLFERELAACMEGEASAAATAHLQECAACSVVIADLQAIRVAARELPAESPSPVVWATVRSRLEAEGILREPAAGWRQILAWRLFPQAVPLGVLAILMALGAGLTLPPNTAPHVEISVDATAQTPDSFSAPQSATPVPANDEASLARVVSDLEVSYKANEASMAPDLKATYAKSLVSLDGSIRECLDSLHHEPRNTLAREYLLTAYTRKAEVLTSALEFDGR